MPEQEPQEPAFPRPWYYRAEYMLPMLIFWPAGAILVLRSPWNSNTMIGGLAWAVIIVGAVLGIRWIQAAEYQPLMTFYVPGFLLTLVTQVQWARYRTEMAGEEEASGRESDESRAPTGPPRPSARRRSRNPKAGRFKN